MEQESIIWNSEKGITILLVPIPDHCGGMKPFLLYVLPVLCHQLLSSLHHSVINQVKFDEFESQKHNLFLRTFLSLKCN